MLTVAKVMVVRGEREKLGRRTEELGQELELAKAVSQSNSLVDDHHQQS